MRRETEAIRAPCAHLTVSTETEKKSFPGKNSLMLGIIRRQDIAAASEVRVTRISHRKTITTFKRRKDAADRDYSKLFVCV